MNRRGFLAATAAACAPLPAFPRRFSLPRLFWLDHRPRDLADSYAEWPSMKIDQPLPNDYRETFALIKRLGFEDLCVWGI